MKADERKSIWLARSEASDLAAKNEGLYEFFAAKAIPDNVRDNIEKDLDRTVPAMRGENKESLRRVLHAVAAFSHEIGYVQGLNYLAATLLYHVQLEASAFWIMVQLFKRYSFSEYYKRGMPGLVAFFEVLEEGVKLHAPSLASHFETESILVNMFAMKWALTLFGCKAKLEHSAAIMDIFLQIGWDFLINLSLALLIESQTTLCQLPSEDILVHIENIPCDFNLDHLLRITSVLMHKTRKMKLKKAGSLPLLIAAATSSFSSSLSGNARNESSSSAPSSTRPST